MEWELFQTFLGFAFTVQQESLKTKLLKPALSDSLAEGLHPALERIAACARNLTAATGAAIALGGADAMVCVARSGAAAPPIGAPFDASAGLSGECIRTGESAICVNAAADPRVNYQACRALNVASMLYLPLRSAQGNMIGMLGVFSSQPLHFSQRDISCLQFTEGLVQQALGRTAADPDPATLAVLLQQANASLPTQPAETVAEENMDASVTPAELSSMIWAAATAPAKTVAPEVVRQPVVAPRPKPEAIFVGRVVDDSVRDSETDISLAAERTDESERRSHIPAMLAVLVALVIAFAGLNYNHFFPGQSEVKSPALKVRTAPQAAAAVAEPALATNHSDAAEQALTPAVSLRSGETNATVTILLRRAIRFEGYQLSNPERIYFDLHDIALTDEKGNAFKNDEGLVAGVRLSEYAAGITRIVFDLRHPATFDARLADKPPRLIIELQRTRARSSEGNPETPAKTAGVDLAHPSSGKQQVLWARMLSASMEMHKLAATP